MTIFFKAILYDISSISKKVYDVIALTVLYPLLIRLSGYGFIDVGLPPASPSDREIDSTVCEKFKKINNEYNND